MPILNKTSQEQILVPLRELYKRDYEQRKVIATYANNFKLRGSFLHKEADFIQERISKNDPDDNLITSALDIV